MRHLAISLCAYAVSLCGFVLPATPQTVQSVAATASRSVCIVLADSGNGTTSGTGFVVADGFVLTGHHVVQGASQLRVLCPEHPAIEAKLVNADADNDVALLRGTLLSIPPLPLGDSAKAQVGQVIVVIGFPRADLTGAETATVTQGIVSSMRAGALQIQAPVGPGNSGSPVLTLQGQVVGVVRAVLGNQVGSNLATSFATGIDATKPFLTLSLGLYGGVAVGSAPPVRRATTPDPNFAIIPGQGIGDAKLGMHRNELEALLGPPKHVSLTTDGGSLIEWQTGTPPRGPYAVLSSTGEVVLLGVDIDPRYAVQGLHFGLREIDVRGALGEPSRVDIATNKTTGFQLKVLYYDSLGLRISIGIVNSRSSLTDGLVVTIGVFRPGCIFSGSPPALQSGTCK